MESLFIKRCSGRIPIVTRSPSKEILDFFEIFIFADPIRSTSVPFSFLLSIPVILGANIFQFLEIISSSVKSSDWGNLFLIFFVSMIISLITINFTLKWAQKIKFWLFGFYGVVFGLFTLALQII